MKQLHTMLRTDARRMFRQPLLYILMAVSFIIPVLVLTMVTGFADPSEAGMVFTNVWQMIGSLPSPGTGSSMSMDMTAMMNINMLYFMAAVLVCIFAAEDFRSGYAKNLFTVRVKKSGYVFSKLIVCSIASAILFLAFLTGSLMGGKIAGLSFAMNGFTAFNLLMSMLSKLFIIPMFVSVFMITASIARKRLWLSLCLSFTIGMLFFMIVPMMTGLTASVLSTLMCLAGGVLFSLWFGVISNGILSKVDLV